MDYPNIFLIVIDALRKDALHVYGSSASTPNLNELTKDSIVLPNAIAPSPWMVPSHMSFFTGIYPREHGVHEVSDKTDAYVLEKLKQYEGPSKWP